MSIRIMNRVWDLSQADGGALLALLALADNATDEGFAWPSIASIAQRARLSTRQTTTVLAKLREAGEIEYAIGHGRGNVSVYVVLVGLAERERQQKVKELHDKADEIMQSLRVSRERKAQKLRVLGAENMKSAHIKHEVEIAALAVPTPDHALIHHEIHHGGGSHESSSTTTTPLPPTDAADAAGGGGGVIDPPQQTGRPGRTSRKPATPSARLLADKGFGAAAVAEFGNLPVEVLSADIARREAMGQGPGAMVLAWRVAPPTEVPTDGRPDRGADERGLHPGGGEGDRPPGRGGGGVPDEPGAGPASDNQGRLDADELARIRAATRERVKAQQARRC